MYNTLLNTHKRIYKMYTFSFFELYNVEWKIFCLHDVSWKNMKRQINNDQSRQKKPFDQSIINSIIFRRHIENGKGPSAYSYYRARLALIKTID